MPFKARFRSAGRNFLPLLFLFFGAPWIALAQDDVPAPELPPASEGVPQIAPELAALRVASPPRIDGILDEPQWQDATVLDRFTQSEPDEGKPATQGTEVRVLYDEAAIYFGVRLHDSGKVTAKLARRDTDLESDWFTVGLDPHHDHLSGAGFSVNPAGVQRDERFSNDTTSDESWDAVWDSAVTTDAGGWSLELRIPYSQLRFPEREAHVWGINFERVINRLNEEDLWVITPRNETGDVSRFGHLTGIAGIRPPRALEIVPYVTARADLLESVGKDDPLTGQNEYAADFGVDVKWGITSNLTLTGAINPDFGQVEVDPAVVNLSQYETFFPEKRAFFVEGSDIFAFGNGAANFSYGFNFSRPQWFYSRRIGRAPQGAGALPEDTEFSAVPSETTILGAAKLSGRTAGGWTIGILDAVTQRESADFQTTELRTGAQEVEPLTNYFIGRSTRDLGSQARVGVFGTSVLRDLPDRLSFLRERAYSGGIDGYWALGERDYLFDYVLGATLIEGAAEAIDLAQRSSARYYQRPDASYLEYDPKQTSLSGTMGRLHFAKQTGNWRASLQAQTYSPGFDVNDLGFMQRADMTSTHAVGIYNQRKPGRLFRSHSHSLAKYQNWNTGGDLLANGIFSSNYWQLLNYWSVNLYGGYGLEVLDDRLTRGGPLSRKPSGVFGGAFVGTDSRKKLYFEAGGDFEHGFGAGGWYLFASTIWNPGSNLKVSFSPSYGKWDEEAQFVRRVDDETAVHTFGTRYVHAALQQSTLELPIRLDWTFSPRLSLQVYLQPFLAVGQYSDFKEFARPRRFDFNLYGQDSNASSTIGYDAESETYAVDPDGAGTAAEFTFANPDFNYKSLRGNLVLRWEYLPGSALFFVWTQNRADETIDGQFRPGRNFRDLGSSPADNVFLIKLSYWWNP